MTGTWNLDRATCDPACAVEYRTQLSAPRPVRPCPTRPQVEKERDGARLYRHRSTARAQPKRHLGPSSRLAFAGASPQALAVPLAFAGGAVLASVIDTLAPEAFGEGGPLIALASGAGFVTAYMLNI